MRFRRTLSNCKECPQRDRIRIRSEYPDEGTEHSKLLFIFPFPQDKEVLNDKVIAGGPSDVMNYILHVAEIRRDRIGLMNILSCQPVDNDATAFETEEAFNCCASGVKEELEFAYKQGYRTLLLHGQAVLDYFRISGKASSLRGSIITPSAFTSLSLPPFRAVCTLNPLDFLKKTWKRSDGGKADATMVYAQDIQKAQEISDSNWKPQEEHFNTDPSFLELRNFLRNAIETKALLGADIETSSLDPEYGEVVVLGLAISETEAISIPFHLKSNHDSCWGMAEMAEIKKLLEQVFIECSLIFQNGFFDVYYMIRKGWKIPMKWAHDTMLLHSVIAPEQEHNLGFITSIFGKTAYWKDEFKNRKGSIYDMDSRKMREYNLRDCVVLLQVLDPMLKKAEELNVIDEYRNCIMQLVEPVMVMQVRGVQFAFNKMTRFKELMSMLTSQKEKELKEIAQMLPGFNLDSDDDMRWFLYGIPPKKFAKLPELETKKKKDTLVYKKLLDVLDVQNTKPIYIPSSYKPLSTDGGNASVGKDGLLSYRLFLNNRLDVISMLKNPDAKAEEVEQITTLMNWLNIFQEYGEFQKLFTSFTSYKPGIDGRIRCKWNIHGTTTGRLSCSEPNLMQLPKAHDESEVEKSEIRNFFIAPEGRSFVSADFENAEVCILGCETLDPIILDAYESGKKIHDMNVKALFGIDRSDPNFEHAKAAAKVFQFGRIQYGGGDRGVYKQVVLKAPKFPLTFSQFAEASKRWFEAHPAFDIWDKWITNLVLAERRIYTEFGRVREFHGNDANIVREAKSTRIQGAVAGWMNRCFIKVWQEVKPLNIDAFPVFQIHDQLVYECDDKDIPVVSKIIKDTMTKPFMYRGFSRVMRIDLSVGKTLGALE